MIQALGPEASRVEVNAIRLSTTGAVCGDRHAVSARCQIATECCSRLQAARCRGDGYRIIRGVRMMIHFH